MKNFIWQYWREREREEEEEEEEEREKKIPVTYHKGVIDSGTNFSNVSLSQLWWVEQQRQIRSSTTAPTQPLRSLEWLLAALKGRGVWQRMSAN